MFKIQIFFLSWISTPPRIKVKNLRTHCFKYTKYRRVASFDFYEITIQMFRLMV